MIYTPNLDDDDHKCVNIYNEMMCMKNEFIWFFSLREAFKKHDLHSYWVKSMYSNFTIFSHYIFFLELKRKKITKIEKKLSYHDKFETTEYTQHIDYMHILQ